jgi:hypothetical protein
VDARVPTKPIPVPAGLGEPVVPVGPPVLGLRASAPLAADGAVWWAVAVPGDLDGPPGVLQGGLVATLLLALARAVDPFGAPLHLLEVRLEAPTPLGALVHVRARPLDTAVHEVELLHRGRRLARGVVDLTGAEALTAATDLVALAEAPLPRPEPSTRYPTCFACGPSATHPAAVRAHPGWVAEDAVLLGWVPDPVLADPDRPDRVDVAAVAAVLDCASAWATMRPVTARGDAAVLLGTLRLRLADAVEVLDPVRVAARLDLLEGRRARARSAVVDTDGRVLALVDAVHVTVAALPEPEGAAAPVG